MKWRGVFKTKDEYLAWRRAFFDARRKRAREMLAQALRFVSEDRDKDADDVVTQIFRDFPDADRDEVMGIIEQARAVDARRAA